VVHREQQGREIDERAALTGAFRERKARIAFEVDGDQPPARTQDLSDVKIPVNALQRHADQAIELRQARVNRR